MANIFNVARYILSKTGEVTTWKLQKICYYSQAWSLAWTGKPLFEEDFQAWSNGPVSPVLFREHQGKFTVDESSFSQALESDPDLSEDEIETIDTVLTKYGPLEPYELREQSHMESPWIDARGDTPERERSQNIITKEVMGEYYGSF